MKRFVEGVDRGQSTLFPDRLEDWIGDDNPVRVIYGSTIYKAVAGHQTGIVQWPSRTAGCLACGQ